MTPPSNYVSMQFLYFNNLKFRRPSSVIEQVSTVPLDFSQLGIHGFASNKFLFRRKRTTHASVCRKAEIIHAGLIEIHHILIFRCQIKAERHIHRDPTYSFEIHFRPVMNSDILRFKIPAALPTRRNSDVSKKIYIQKRYLSTVTVSTIERILRKVRNRAVFPGSRPWKISVNPIINKRRLFYRVVLPTNDMEPYTSNRHPMFYHTA